MSLRSKFRKRWLRRAHGGGPYLSIRDEKPVRPKPKLLPIKKHDTPKSPHKEHAAGGRVHELRDQEKALLEQHKKQGLYMNNRQIGLLWRRVKKIRAALKELGADSVVEKHDTPRSPHKEHGPKGKHQGAGQAAHAGKLHEGLSSIFSGKYEGAGLMQNAPQPGFNVSIAGNAQDIGKRFQQLEDVDGVWEGEMEQSYMANLPEHADPKQVLRAAASAGKANDQDAVFVRHDGKDSPGQGWEENVEYTVQTPQGVIDIISPSKKNLAAAVKMAKKYGGGQFRSKPVWTKLLERDKHY